MVITTVSLSCVRTRPFGDVAMACELIATEGAVFALWGKPTPADMDRVKAALETAVAACGHPVVYVTRVPVDAPPPDAKVRAHLDKLMPRIVQVCSTYHVVLEGEGFGAAVKRAVLTSIFQLGWHRKTFFVHAKSEEVLRCAEPVTRPAVTKLLAAARAQGLLARNCAPNHAGA